MLGLLAPLLRLRALLSGPRVPLRAALLGVALCLPTLWGGLSLDDFLIRAKARGEQGVPASSPLDLFTFMRGDAAFTRHMVDHGFVPWFVPADLKLAFLRPLSSLTHWLDYRLWPGATWAMHAQNLAWFFASALLAATLYRRLLAPRWAAGLAAALFAIDDTHGIPIGWLANRNALLATTFALAALLAHDRWRRDGWRLGALVGPACLLLGLLSAELAIGGAGYLLAYAVVLDPAPRRERARSLAPYAVALVVWRVAYVLAGCGTHGSGAYVDPALDPLAFLAGVPANAVGLVRGLFASPPAELTPLAPSAYAPALLVFTLALLGVVAWVFAPVVRRDPATRFFLFGALLAVVPACATWPSGRTLIVASFGGAAVVARVLVALAEDDGLPASRAWRRGAAVVGWGLVVLHGVVAPVALLVVSNFPALLWWQVDRLRAQTDVGEGLERKAVIAVNAPNAFAAYLWALPCDGPRPAPAYAATLSVSVTPVGVTRPDANTLVLSPGSGFLGEKTAELFRDPAMPMRRGDAYAFDTFSVVVDEVDAAGQPRVATFRFARPLEDESFLWVAWDGERIGRWTPPAIGGSTVLASGHWP